MGDNFENISNSEIINRSKVEREGVDKQYPWYRRPLGLILIGFIVAVLGYLFQYLVF